MTRKTEHPKVKAARRAVSFINRALDEVAEMAQYATNNRSAEDELWGQLQRCNDMAFRIQQDYEAAP